MNKFSKSGGILNLISLIASGIFQGISLFVLLLMLDIANTANDITVNSVIWSAFLVFCFIILLIAIIFTIICLVKNKNSQTFKSSLIITTIILSFIAIIPNIYYIFSMAITYIIIGIIITLPIIIANILIIKNLIKYNKINKVNNNTENI